MFKPGETRRWAVAKRIDWHLYAKGSGLVLSIEPGYEFESSVPRCLTWLMDPDDPRLLLAACIHDHLLERYKSRHFPSAGEWYDAALAGGYPKVLAVPAALFVALRGAIVENGRRQYSG